VGADLRAIKCRKDKNKCRKDGKKTKKISVEKTRGGGG
jgi:hypothetical protein